ncbi:MAG: diaminopimelate epimerase [Crenarchaeota archaeon]|nr:diaminopimelate epimerase [Thermoproteota archaeon]
MRFWKMHGLGNDYIVIDNRAQVIPEKRIKHVAAELCERRFSIGADGLLLVFPSKVADIRMRIFNSDGSEAEMCGNGIRCFSKYCYENGIVNKTTFSIETLAGIKQVWLTLQGKEVTSVRADMGAPSWSRSALPMVGEGEAINETLLVEGEPYKITCLSMGNPHCVIFTDNVSEFPVVNIGAIIEYDKFFPKRTNVVFSQVINRNEMHVRVWERGCGETLACGTGTCAAVAAANRLGKVNNKVTAHLLGGELCIEVNETIFLSGETEKVFEGTLFKEIQII